MERIIYKFYEAIIESNLTPVWMMRFIVDRELKMLDNINRRNWRKKHG